ncbi:hypothetical protein [Nocardioides astragali]|uniref:Uncharacterized protein n=1 Tax=Nocardioides astragali TaxID=1776736 RepID=A0ABW2N358_9ACTN|nr:hypothetical protein [Nocardioides astragali]
MEIDIGLDDLGLGDIEHPPDGLGGDHPRDRVVDHADLVEGEVP